MVCILYKSYFSVISDTIWHSCKLHCVHVNDISDYTHTTYEGEKRIANGLKSGKVCFLSNQLSTRL